MSVVADRKGDNWELDARGSSKRLDQDFYTVYTDVYANTPLIRFSLQLLPLPPNILLLSIFLWITTLGTIE